MKLPGQTQLTQLDRLPAALREQLRSLWIESAEEYVALLSAVDPSVASQGLGAKADALEDSRLQACQFIAPPKASALAQARKGGAMGCFIKPDMLEAFVHAGRLRPPRATLPTGFGSGKLPSSVRLTDQMRPVKDQGERGTCVAFSSVALREFLEKASEVFTKGEKALKTEEDFKQKAVMLYKTIGQKSIGLKKNFIDQTPVRAAFYD